MKRPDLVAVLGLGQHGDDPGEVFFFLRVIPVEAVERITERRGFGQVDGVVQPRAVADLFRTHLDLRSAGRMEPKAVPLPGDQAQELVPGPSLLDRRPKLAESGRQLFFRGRGRRSGESSDDGLFRLFRRQGPRRGPRPEVPEHLALADIDILDDGQEIPFGRFDESAPVGFEGTGGGHHRQVEPLAREQVKELLEDVRVDDPVSRRQQKLGVGSEPLEGPQAGPGRVGRAGRLGLIRENDVRERPADRLDHLARHRPDDDDVPLGCRSGLDVQGPVDGGHAVDREADLMAGRRLHPRALARREDDAELRSTDHGRLIPS